jgi:hypothetical protein
MFKRKASLTSDYANTHVHGSANQAWAAQLNRSGTKVRAIKEKLPGGNPRDLLTDEAHRRFITIGPNA